MEKSTGRKKFVVEITETLQRQITINKSKTIHTQEDAIKEAKRQYYNGEIVLDSDDYKDTDFAVILDTEEDVEYVDYCDI